MNLKRAFLAILAVTLSGVALAQTIVPPYINGKDDSGKNQIVEVGMLALNRNTALTALAGGAQAGTALTLGYNRFTVVATAADSAQLPAVGGGAVVVVTNADASDSMNVFPQTGGIINAGSPNAAFAVAAGKTAIFFQAIDTSGATIWYAVLTA